MSSSYIPRILIVDDEPQIRKAVTEWFYQRGFHVSEAENGQRAVDICANEVFDIVLMDMEMPVMKGPEAIERIRQHCPSVPIIVFSGFSHDIHKASEVGANQVLQKPLSLRDLEQEVRKLLPEGSG